MKIYKNKSHFFSNGGRAPDAPVLDPPLIPHATPKYLPRQATNGEPNQQSSLCRAPVLTDRQSASDIRMAEIETGMVTMFLLLNFDISILRKEKCTTCKFH